MSAATTITLQQDGVVARLSCRDDEQRPRLLQVNTTDAHNEGSATAAFHVSNQWCITWSDSQRFQDCTGEVSLATLGKVEGEAQWWQAAADGFYLFTGSCGLADSNGVLRLHLTLTAPSSPDASTSTRFATPYAHFHFTLSTTLAPHQFRPTPLLHPLPMKPGSNIQNSSTQKDIEASLESESKERKSPLIIKLKIPPASSQRKSKPKPPPFIVAEEIDSAYLSPISEVTEPPTSPAAVTMQALLSPEPKPTPPSPPQPQTSTQPTDRKRPRPEPEAVLVDVNLKSRGGSAEVERPLKRLKLSREGEENREEPASPPSNDPCAHPQAQLDTQQSAPSPCILSLEDIYGTGAGAGVQNQNQERTKEDELRQLQSRNEYLASVLCQAEQLNIHYQDTATALLNRLPARKVAEHLQQQLANPSLSPQQRVDIALAKQRAAAEVKRSTAAVVSAKVQGLLDIFATMM